MSEKFTLKACKSFRRSVVMIIEKKTKTKKKNKNKKKKNGHIE